MEENLDFVGTIKKELNLSRMNPADYSSLNLAYIGDDAYDLVVRTYLMSLGNYSVNKLNNHANKLVKATTQSKMVDIIMPHLTEEETGVYKRGRNAKSATSAKNASIGEYRRATGFEALMGYLYLRGDYGRMVQLIRIGLEGVGEKFA